MFNAVHVAQEILFVATAAANHDINPQLSRSKTEELLEDF